MDVNIGAYLAVMGACALFSCALFGVSARNRLGLSSRRALSLGVCTLLLGTVLCILCAKVLFFFFRFSYLTRNRGGEFWLSLRTEELSYYGGVAGVSFAVMLCARLFRLNVRETLNAFAAKGITGFEDVFFRVAGLHAPARRAAMALPEHALFGSLPDQVRKSRSFRQFIAAIPLLDTLMILTGGLCHLLPEHFMNLMASLIVLILACVQLIAAIRRLSATHWNFRQQRPILSFSVLTAGLAVILFTKQSALFLLSSTIFGIGFLINAVMRSAEIREAGTWWIRLGHIFETGTSVLLGGFILLAPERTILWYMHACGTFLILDGVFRLLRYVASGKQPAAGSENP